MRQELERNRYSNTEGGWGTESTENVHHQDFYTCIVLRQGLGYKSQPTRE